MADGLHSAATNHLPIFITAPGQVDVLMVVTGFILLGGVIGFGIIFLTLHTLPERLAHKSQKLQFEIVAVLGLIALFTHEHIFWVAGLLLALIDLPDVGGWMSKISGSIERLADRAQGEKPAPAQESIDRDSIPVEGPGKPKQEHFAPAARSDGAANARPELVSTRSRG